jgi:hypothetical protein
MQSTVILCGLGVLFVLRDCESSGFALLSSYGTFLSEVMVGGANWSLLV